MKGFVNFHGGLKTPEGQNYSETTGAILILLGSVDPVSDMDDVTNLVKEIRVILKYVFVRLQEVMVLIMFIACELAINLKLKGHLVISYFRKILRNKS